MKLSVVIPCYNELKTIDEIINRVNNCGIKNKEIIIVDDIIVLHRQILIAQLIMTMIR